MQKRVLGRTGLKVSAIGCGGIPIGRAEIPEAVRVLQKAVDLGTNYFDTAVGRAPKPLNDEEREWLRLERLRWEKCYCRLCYTCNPCPLDVPVQSLVILDLNYRRLGLKTQMDWGLKEWLEAVNKCETCEACQVKCAYDMPIRKLMLDVRRRYLPIVEAYK